MESRNTFIDPRPPHADSPAASAATEPETTGIEITDQINNLTSEMHAIDETLSRWANVNRDQWNTEKLKKIDTTISNLKKRKESARKELKELIKQVREGGVAPAPAKGVAPAPAKEPAAGGGKKSRRKKSRRKKSRKSKRRKRHSKKKKTYKRRR